MPDKTVTDKDVEKSREKVEKLREQLAAANFDLVTSEQSRNNAVTKARLDAEAERLQAQLAAAKDRLKVSKSGDPIVEQIKESVAPQEVDTTPEPHLNIEDADSTKEK
jgi:hypothetical protein